MTGSDWNGLEERPRLASVRIGAIDLRPGDLVRLRPKNRADIFDLALEGKVATIEAIECDYESQVYLAVVVNDDPGRDLGMLKQVGHRFFFATNEVEPLDGDDALGSTT